MYSIGEFASIGRVSVRMLRHYDEIGLLRPAQVDPSSGYRFYEGGQFAVLGRIVAFKDLGFSLVEVARIVHGDVDVDALDELLTARRAALASQLELDTGRLHRVEAHLRHIRGETTMPTITTELKALPARRVARATATAAGFGSVNISPVIGPLFDRLYGDLMAAGVRPAGEPIAAYESDESGDGTGVLVHAACPVSGDVSPAPGFDITEMPGAELAVTTVHHGAMDSIDESWTALLSWAEANGYQLAGLCREVYHVSQPEPQDHWVTELQQPVVPA